MPKFSRIAGTGSYLPEKILSNAELEQMVDTTDQWILERTGISQRHIIADHETTSSMAAIAGKKACEAAGILTSEIDFIIVGTATPDRTFPSTSCILQDRLNVRNNCPALDVNAACAGFIYALSIADLYIKSGQVRNALVVGSEALSRVVDWTDRSTCILFSDGAGAAILQPSEESGILSTHIHADGSYQKLLYAPNHLGELKEPPYVQMKGREVFKIAVQTLGSVVDETLQHNQIDKSEIDWLIPHQANLRIIKAVAKKLELPMERVILTVQEQGNTSAASIPLALDKAVRSGQVKRDDLIIVEAFGAGLAWGSALFRY